MKCVLRGHKSNIQKICDHLFKAYFSINQYCVGNFCTFVKFQQHNILFRKKQIYFLCTCKKNICEYESEKEEKKKNNIINFLNYHDHNKKILTKECLIKNERDIINILQECIKNEKKNILITPQNIVELLQAYSKYKYYNEDVIKLIILYMKYNMNKFSFIKLCVCLNYFVNLNIKNEPSFNNIISNIIMKKIKNDEYIDLYALCMVIKYLLKKNIDDINLIYMLVVITKRKISEGLYNIYDIYNLILSFLNIQTNIINPRSYKNKQNNINNINNNNINNINNNNNINNINNNNNINNINNNNINNINNNNINNINNNNNINNINNNNINNINNNNINNINNNNINNINNNNINNINNNNINNINNNNNNNNYDNNSHIYGQDKNYINKCHNTIDHKITSFNEYSWDVYNDSYNYDNPYTIYEYTKKINEENIYNMLHIYINFDNKNNNDIILMLHNLRNNISQKSFTYKMYMNNDDKKSLYENLLKQIHFKNGIQPQYIALLLINVMKFIKDSELSEELFLHILKNVHTHMKEVVMNTKEHEMSKYKQFYNDKKRKELFTFNNNINTFCAQQKVSFENSQNDEHIKNVFFEKHDVFYPSKKNENPYVENIKNNKIENKTRKHFNIQEIGLIFEFYTYMQNYIKERKRQNHYNIDIDVDVKFDDTLDLDVSNINSFMSHTGMYDNKRIVQGENIYKYDVNMNKIYDAHNNLNKFRYHNRSSYFFDKLIVYRDVYKLYINILKKCLYLYSLYKKKEDIKKEIKYSCDNINMITYCKVFKGYLEIYNKNNFIDKEIFYSFFEEFFLIQKKEKRLCLNEICDILKIIHTCNNTYVLESLLYNNRESKLLFIVQNNLINHVTNEMNRIRKENLYFVIMSFYYLSFMKCYNIISYLTLINLILRNIKNKVCIKYLPYVIIGIINFYKLHKKIKISKNKEKEEYKYNENINKNDIYEEDNITSLNDIYKKGLNKKRNKQKKKKFINIKNNSFYIYNDNKNGNFCLLPFNDNKYINNEIKIYRLHILYILLNKYYSQYNKIYYILNCIYMLIKLIKDKDLPTTYNYISKFHLLEIFKKLENYINKNKIEEKYYIDNFNIIINIENFKKKNFENNNTHIYYYNNYDYFINYVKYIYCISYLNYYIDLNKFLYNIINRFKNNFEYSFYTPFNSYLLSNFFYNYEYMIKEKYNEMKNLYICSYKNKQNVLQKYIKNIALSKYIDIEKKTYFYKCIKYLNNCNSLNIYNIIYIIKTYKFLCYYINHYNVFLLNKFILFLYIYQNIKMSSLYELLIQYTKFLYYLEYIQKAIFFKCNKSNIKVILFLFIILSKFNINSLENNYIGILQISLLYMSYFVKGFHNILPSLPLHFLRHLNLYLGMSMIKNLDTYDNSYSFQICIVNILKGVIKKKKRIMNEYNIQHTPYTIDILIK
ncbi:mitochondrial rpoD precursor, putative [Plasmodium sp. gorilla clade G3]|nr:mitochondrial rpoD precursor, putative [Plasmodium sp. gorilla clade G3]